MIRHAEAEGNLYRIAQGQSNSTITERGYRQIAALKQRFEKIPIDAVYSSDLYRTCVTAGAVYLPKHLPLHRRKDLREICVGEWEEKTWGEIARKDSEMMLNFAKHLERWRIPGAESPEQVRDRILNALGEIAAENDGKTVAVFSHGCAIRILLGTLQGYSIAQLGETPHSDNTAVSLIEADGAEMRVIFRDDSSHLREESSACTARVRRLRPNALEPGLCFSRICLPEEAEWLKSCVADAWADSGDARTMDGALLLEEAANRPTLKADLAGKPVGVVQMNPQKDSGTDRGWISLYCIGRTFRTRGYGIQLLGQAVRFYRTINRNRLCLALPEGAGDARRFFSEYGFTPLRERTRDGRGIWSKDIGFRAL
jgi:probable phosphoglycerate mutase